MSADLVTYRPEGRVGVVALNRPDKLNALTMPMRLALERTLREADADPDTNVVRLRGEGRAFCVGFDLGPKDEAGRPDGLRYHERLGVSLRALMTPWTMTKPVIACVQGFALGGGCELAMFCDLAIAAETAEFGEPEILFSQAGPGLVLPFLIGMKRARELLYFGDRIGAREALDLGMINRVVPTAELEEASRAYAQRLARIGREALAAMKLAINRGAEAAGLRNAIQAGLDVVAPLYAADTEVRREFEAIRNREGLKAALRWRREQMEG